MNEELVNIIKTYSTESHEKLNQNLLGKSKDVLIGVITDLITAYINDKNSSTLRELITVTLAGYQHIGSKIGYNGYRHDTSVDGERVMCEAKPKNIVTKGEKQVKRRLKGAGNFSDYTHARLKRDLGKELYMLVSGFVDGRLLYLFEFPFNSKKFVDRLKEQLEKRFPNGDKKGEYLRSASFDYRHYLEEKNTRAVYLPFLKKLEDNRKFINQKFYKKLLKKSKDYEAEK